MEPGLVALDQVLENVTFVPADGVDTVAVVIRRRELGQLDVQVASNGVDVVNERTRRTWCRIPEVVVRIRVRHRVVAHVSRASRRPDVFVLPKPRRSGLRVGPRLARIE